MKSVVAVMHPKTTHNIHSYLLGRAWMAVSSVSSFVVRSFDNSNYNYYQSIYSYSIFHIHSINIQPRKLVMDFHVSGGLCAFDLATREYVATGTAVARRRRNLDG